MKIKKFKTPIYPCNVTIILETDLNKVAKKYNLESLEQYNAVTLNLKNSFVLAFTDKNDLGTIAHEIIHLKNHIFNFINFKQDNDNDEAEAYLVGYLFKK